MKLTKCVRILIIVCSIVLLSGCASKRGAGYNGGMGGPDGGAQASGLGENENFGGEGGGAGAGGHRRASNNTYYFDYDSNSVHPDDKPAIIANASRIANTNRKVTVEGHTDPRGSREYNIALGERRANAVAELMKSRGVSSRQVRVVSYGAQRPAAPGHDEQAFQLDRRAHIAN